MLRARPSGSIKHSWLLEPGIWEATGLFWAGSAKRPVRGRSIVRHGHDLWEIEAEMEIPGDPPTRFENRYEVDPPVIQEGVISWHSRNPAIGVLHGTFSLMERTIVSVYRSESGDYSGAECLTWISTDSYLAAGILCSSGEVISRWEVDLARRR